MPYALRITPGQVSARVAGALLLLLVTGTPLNVSSFMGLILLVGLIVKNGTILLDFTRHRMRAGGLALSTPITLFIVPTLLVAIRGRGYRLGSPTPEGDG